MSRILIITEHDWLAKVCQNFFGLIGWRSKLLTGSKKRSKDFKKIDALILPMKSRRQVIIDLNWLKTITPGLEVVCVLSHKKSPLRTFLKKEGVGNFISIDSDQLEMVFRQIWIKVNQRLSKRKKGSLKFQQFPKGHLKRISDAL